MLLYEKELSRKLEQKTHELLHVLEEKKDSLLKELSGVDKITLTKLRKLMNDYYNAESQLSEWVQKYTHDLTIAQGTISHEFEKMESDVAEKTEKAMVDFSNDLAKIRSDFLYEIKKSMEDYLLSDIMQDFVENGITESIVHDLIQGYDNRITNDRSILTDTDNHVYKLDISHNSFTNLVKMNNGEFNYGEMYKSSNFIKCPKNLCLSFSDIDARCFLYFYEKQSDGTYLITDKIYNTVSSEGSYNFISAVSVPFNLIQDIPDNIYIKLIGWMGTVELYGWDGKKFGVPLSANPSFPSTDGSETWLFNKGTSGILADGRTKMLIAKNGYFKVILGIKGDERKIVSSRDSKFVILPDGYDYFRIRYVSTPSYDNSPKETFVGDVSENVFASGKCHIEHPVSYGVKVIENARKINNFKWKPKKDIRVNSKTTISYKAGVSYNGLPYSSNWVQPHFIGWHISPHTFINAVNDEDSVFYHETAFNSKDEYAPYYGIVCSSFATMCSGWSVPQTNSGFFYSPDTETVFSIKPDLGAIYTDVYTHCVIPEKFVHYDDKYLICGYESVRPLSQRTTRYGSLKYGTLFDWWDTTPSDDYYTDYGYNVYHHNAKGDLSNVPYADFDNWFINDCTALPYKGDKCVYTSRENVLVNIKDESANTLYIRFNDQTTEIPITAKRMDISDHVKIDGIYYIHTNIDSEKKSSFEFVNVNEITYHVGENNISFSDDFWYADFVYDGHILYRNNDGSYQHKGLLVEYQENNDYSKFFTKGNPKYIEAVFKKGIYGAYTVPFKEV